MLFFSSLGDSWFPPPISFSLTMAHQVLIDGPETDRAVGE